MTDVARIELHPDYEITRVIRGGWQLAGGHGTIDREAAIGDLVAAFDAGVTTFDCADIYTGVEELARRVPCAASPILRGRSADAAKAIKVHTKLVPDLAALAHVDKVYLERIVDRSLLRLRVERLDLVQFHWWSYPGCQGLDRDADRLRSTK